MDERFSRTELLLGSFGMQKLKNARIIVFGVGGVGGYAVEALSRSGIGNITLVDSDTVSLTNINRQIIATSETVGQYKTDAFRQRISQINPECKDTVINSFYSPENADEIDLAEYDYIIDAIDTVSSKIELIVRAKAVGVPIISSMGAGNKLDPCAFKVSDIYKTAVCPLAKAVRVALKKKGIKKLKVVYSEETPCVSAMENGKRVPASCAFIPSVAGLIVASEVIKDLIK
jgi:tRNA A37 threonylcarbamoyladenosine dehydratase